MEVVQDEEAAGPSGGSTYVEYEMTPDAAERGAAEEEVVEVDQAMEEDAAHQETAGEEEGYEVMMEEYAEGDHEEQGEMQEAADSTHEGENTYVEEAGQAQQHEVDPEVSGEGQGDGEEEELDAMDGTTATHDGDEEEHEGEDDANTEYQEDGEGGEHEAFAEDVAADGNAKPVQAEGADVPNQYDQDGAAVPQSDGDVPAGSHKDTAEVAAEVTAGVSHEGTSVDREGQQDGRDIPEAEGTNETAAGTGEVEDRLKPGKSAEIAYQGEGEEEANAEDAEDSNEVEAPPPMRVTFNGQDFVLFPQSEASSYISTTEAEPVAAPQLKADAGIFFESLDSLFQALRVKDSLGDFLEEGSELQISFVDLELILREDDVYAREVTLNDIHRIHIGYGLSSSLHLDISEKPRFISRYNDLAAHVSSAVEEQTVDDADAEEESVAATAMAATEEHGAAVEDGGEAGQHDAGHAGDEEGAVIGQASEEGDGEDDREEEAIDGEDETEKGDVTSAIDETFITVNETADDTAEEAEDIVDYDEAYQNGEDGAAEGNPGADAEYEENGYGEAEGEEGEQEGYEDEEEKESSQARQKRAYDDGNDDEEPVASTEYEESDAKRVKVDG